jgi:predicted HTH transcriptional regulator
MSALFDDLKSIGDIEALVAAKIRESEVLEYKRADEIFSDRAKIELVKDVTGMANSLGGLIVYGVATDPKDKTCPFEIVPININNIETIDRVINAQVKPYILGIRKCLIPEADPRVLLVDIPESQDPPHQNLYDKKVLSPFRCRMSSNGA